MFAEGDFGVFKLYFAFDKYECNLSGYYSAMTHLIDVYMTAT